MKFTPHIGLILAGSLSSCATTSPPMGYASPKVHQGMTGLDLLQAFGRPLHVRRNTNGGEDWVYPFLWEQVQSGRFTPEADGKALRIVHAIHQWSVHLSPSGTVTGPIPRGTVILNFRE